MLFQNLQSQLELLELLSCLVALDAGEVLHSLRFQVENLSVE